jgi:hypothetical protein
MHRDNNLRWHYYCRGSPLHHRSFVIDVELSMWLSRLKLQDRGKQMNKYIICEEHLDFNALPAV